jgi:hypothetical protein
VFRAVGVETWPDEGKYVLSVELHGKVGNIEVKLIAD